MQARFVQFGNSIDYRPETAVNAGEVVILGNLVCVARTDINAGELGALSVHGIYEVEKNGDAFSAGDTVYWDPAAKKAVKSGIGAEYLGKAIAAAAGDSPTVFVWLNAAADISSTIIPSPPITEIDNRSGGHPGDIIFEVDLGVRDAVATLVVKVNKIIEVLRKNHFLEGEEEENGEEESGDAGHVRRCRCMDGQCNQ